MMKYKAVSKIFFLCSTLSAVNCFTPTAHSAELLTSPDISFSSPLKAYKKLSTKTINTQSSTAPKVVTFTLEYQNELGGNSADIGDVCFASISDCAKSNLVQYYYNEDNQIQLDDPTVQITPIKLEQWIGYEAYPLCGWANKNGRFNQYGGQCYIAVISNATKTVSIKYLLGENGGSSKCDWKNKVKAIHESLNNIK